MRARLTNLPPLGRALVGGLLLGAAIVLAVLIGEPLVGETIVVLALINLIATAGLSVFSSNSGIMSFGHAAFFGVGAYTSSLLTMDAFSKELLVPTMPGWLVDIHMGLWPALVVTLLLTGVIAYVVGWPLMRLPSLSVSIASFGVLIIAGTVFIAATQITNGSGAFYGVPGHVDKWTALALAIAAVVGARLFRDTGVGLQLRASREDDFGARASGVRVERARRIAWTLSAMVAATGGVAFAGYLTAFSPRAFNFDATFVFITMLVVGGRESTIGVVVGVLAITAVSELLDNVGRSLESGLGLDLVGLPQIGAALLLLAVMIFRREGIAGALELDERLTRRARPQEATR
jgi:branched-chain amino acid transport system permease protein